jgi:hypothetical protein
MGNYKVYLLNLKFVQYLRFIRLHVVRLRGFVMMKKPGE